MDINTIDPIARLGGGLNFTDPIQTAKTLNTHKFFCKQRTIKLFVSLHFKVSTINEGSKYLLPETGHIERQT
jgi:hypothetical protein